MSAPAMSTGHRAPSQPLRIASASPTSAATATGQPSSFEASSRRCSNTFAIMRVATAPGSRAMTAPRFGNCDWSVRW